MDFPPNNDVSGKNRPQEEKKIDPVVGEDGATRRKKSLGKQFRETFIAGDVKSASRSMIFDVFVPAAKEMIFELGAQGIRELLFGPQARKRFGGTPPQTGPTGYVGYNKFSQPSMSHQTTGPQRALSRQARARHDFDEIVLTSRGEAEEVISRMFDIVSKYDAVTVADLYELVGFGSSHTDQKWGWTDIRGAGVSRVRGGYLLDLPDPQPMAGV